MKKVLSLLMVLIFCLSFVACDASDSQQSSDKQPALDESTEKIENEGQLNTPASDGDSSKDLQKNADGLYELYTAEDLVRYREILEEEMQASYEASGHDYDASSGAILMADIDMSTVCSEELGSWRPIGQEVVRTQKGNLYNGSLTSSLFDGNGYKISGLYISGGSDGALFAMLCETEVRDLTIVDSYVSVENGRAAALATEMRDGVLRNVCIENDVQILVTPTNEKECFYVGGVVAYAKEWNYGATIEGCINHGTVSANISVSGYLASGYIGGIVGETEKKVKVIRCENYGQIYSNGSTDGDYEYIRIGGIVGEVSGDAVYNGTAVGCINYGVVQSASGGRVGGIVGNNVSFVKFCVNVGTVNGGNEALTYGIGTNDGFMHCCLDAGTITGDCAYPIEEKWGISVPAGDTSLTDGSLVTRLNNLAAGEYWVQGDSFPAWSGLE